MVFSCAPRFPRPSKDATSNIPILTAAKPSARAVAGSGRKILHRPLTSLVIVVHRWDEKAGLRTGCGVRSQVIDVLKAQIKRRPAMKKVSTVANRN
jgi:hypothetical protein